MKSERVNVDEAIGDVAMVLVWLNKSEPCTGLVGESSLVVKVKSSRNNWISVVNTGVVVPVVASFVALSSDSPDEFKNWVIEVELHSNLGVGSLHVEGLVLNDEDFVVGCGKSVTLNIIKVNVCCFKASRKVVWCEAASGLAVLDGNICSGNNEALFKSFKFNMNLNTVELE